MITIFKNIYSKEPYYTSVDKALERISKGNSRGLVEEIRNTLDKDKANELKKNLPSVCFSGKFTKERTDGGLLEHSGYLILDFDDVEDLRTRQSEIISHEFVYACWVSPSGRGLKALVKIADGSKHREHFEALRDIFPDADRSGVNPSRVCFESYDPYVYKYPDAVIFATVKTIQQLTIKESIQDEDKIFRNLLTWLTNKNEAFVTGERNNFIFKLACACCKFGLAETIASALIFNEFVSGSTFSQSEASRTIRSAYKRNESIFGTCSFDRDKFIETSTKKEVKVEKEIILDDGRVKDVIYGVDVKEKALLIHQNGYECVKGIDVPEFDERFKPKRGEISCLTGIGNYGKSQLKKWYQVMRILKYGEKFATFSPEDNPPEEYFHDLVEILLGCDCTPANPRNPSRETYERAYDFITKNIFYVYPKDISPTPEYIKERFLELIIKEKVDGVDIDPFNQLANDYGKSGRTDKYLETFLSDCSRFAQTNNVYFWIVAHPHKLSKDATGNYPCPDVFDLADGAMWNNKMDNILVYHRPFAQSAPQDATCEFHSKKIRRQKTVGKKGFFLFEMLFSSRRFYFNGRDYLQVLLNERGISFTELPKPTVQYDLRYPFNNDNDDGIMPF